MIKKFKIKRIKNGKKVIDTIYHDLPYTCDVCKKKIKRGEWFYMVKNNKFIHDTCQ